ncbi:methyltransferase domain-containing protein [Candidatus Photodesmus anomalopis]|uniref:methyltransferase domain-containing protein n=1 Tax=Candidatus Photodesmus anomalopis TaxID=28176 RepID=UPI0003F69156
MQLPFLEKSFYAVILFHQLNYCIKPHQTFHEVNRVMVDNGYLILTGFNPISFLGLTNWIHLRKIIYYY